MHDGGGMEAKKMTTISCRARLTLEQLACIEREGAEDYNSRVADVAAGQCDADWAWPPYQPGAADGVDGEYISAVGPDQICADLGIDPRSWDEIAEDWCEAFVTGYRAAHGEEQGQ